MNLQRNSSPILVRLPQGWNKGFTLIELLTVISIIGVLAGLILGLSGMASTRMRESRVQGELNQLVTAIEAYKATVGFYPPDNTNDFGINPLYYELAGTIYNPTTQTYTTLNGNESITYANVRSFFLIDGFANAARNRREGRSFMKFKPAMVKELSNQPDVEILGVPVKGPRMVGAKKDINPWYYDASSPNRHNLNGFDLWAEITVGKTTKRIGNWKE